ncbi:MAG: Flp pilus assembly protein CpaB [Acetobacteraceae bacterium]
MVLRLAFFALMALGLAGFGTVAWVSTRPPAPDPADVAAATKITVLVAVRPVRAGNLLKPEDIGAKEMTQRDAGEDPTLDGPDVRRTMAGAMVRSSLSVGDRIRAKDVMRPGDHGFLAAVLGPGMRAVSVGVDTVTGTAGLIWPGDKIDVILTQAIGDATIPIGRRTAAETVLSGVRVIAIDQQLVQGIAPEGGADNKSRTVTLEVTSVEAERVSVATRIGRLSLAVRSAERSAAAEPVQPKTTWASDVSPALGTDVAGGTRDILSVFPGAGDRKEYRF